MIPLIIFLCSLENMDEEGKLESKADIFTETYYPPGTPC